MNKQLEFSFMQELITSSELAEHELCKESNVETDKQFTMDIDKYYEECNNSTH